MGGTLVRLTEVYLIGVLQHEYRCQARRSPPSREHLPRGKSLSFAHRLVFGQITDALAADTVRRLLALDTESAAPIQLLVSSPGGHLESGDAIHDVVRFIEAPVHMIGTGWVGSASTHLYLAVPRERRVCLPQTRFPVHQPSGGARNPQGIARLIACETGLDLASVLADIERDRWMSAEETIDYGLVSRIVERRTDIR